MRYLVPPGLSNDIFVSGSNINDRLGSLQPRRVIPLVIVQDANGCVASLAGAPVPATDASPPTFGPGLHISGFSDELGAGVRISGLDAVQDAVSISVLYALVDNISAASQPIAVPAGTVSLLLRDLAPVTRYYFWVRAVDAAGNVAVSDSMSIVTPDLSAPLIPDSITVQAAGPLAHSDPVGGCALMFSQLNLLDDGTVFVLVSPASMPDDPMSAPRHQVPAGADRAIFAGLLPLTQYRAWVEAVDAEGNIGRRAFLLTTPDGLPPTLPAGITVRSDSAGAITVGGLAGVSDDTGTPTVEVLVARAPAGLDAADALSCDPAAAELVVAGLQPGAMYRLWVRATDAAGNVTLTELAPTHTRAADNTVVPPVLTLTAADARTLLFSGLEAQPLPAGAVRRVLLSLQPLLDPLTADPALIAADIALTAGQTQASVGGLVPNTRYYGWSIAAGPGADTNALSARLDASTPPIVTHPFAADPALLAGVSLSSSTAGPSDIRVAFSGLAPLAGVRASLLSLHAVLTLAADPPNAFQDAGWTLSSPVPPGALRLELGPAADLSLYRGWLVARAAADGSVAVAPVGSVRTPDATPPVIPATVTALLDPPHAVRFQGMDGITDNSGVLDAWVGVAPAGDPSRAVEFQLQPGAALRTVEGLSNYTLYDVWVRAVDRSGNASRRDLPPVRTDDIEPPVIPVEVRAFYTSGTSIRVEGLDLIADAGAGLAETRVFYGTGAQPADPGTASIVSPAGAAVADVAGLRNLTSYGVWLRATDASGNAATKAWRVFTPDDTPPVVPASVRPVAAGANAVLFQNVRDITDNSGSVQSLVVRLEADGLTPVVRAVDALTAAGGYLVTGLRASTTYTCWAVASDAYANVTESARVAVTTAVEPETPPPPGAGLRMRGNRAMEFHGLDAVAAARPGWTLDVLHGTSTDPYDSGTTVQLVPIGQAVLAVEGLANLTSYHGWIRAADPPPAGTGSVLYGRMTVTTADDTPPVPPPTSFVAAARSALFYGLDQTYDNSGAPPVVRVHLSLNEDLSDARTETVPTGAPTLTVGGLPQLTQYRAWTTATDDAGNVGAGAARLLRTLDDTLPVLPLTTFAVTGTSVTIGNLASATDNSGDRPALAVLLSTDPTAAAQNGAPFVAVPAGADQYAFSGLANLVTYYWWLRATDASGNAALASGSLTTPDDTPPVLPTAFAAAQVASSYAFALVGSPLTVSDNGPGPLTARFVLSDSPLSQAALLAAHNAAWALAGEQLTYTHPTGAAGASLDPAGLTSARMWRATDPTPSWRPIAETDAGLAVHSHLFAWDAVGNVASGRAPAAPLVLDRTPPALSGFAPLQVPAAYAVRAQGVAVEAGSPGSLVVRLVLAQDGAPASAALASAATVLALPGLDDAADAASAYRTGVYQAGQQLQLDLRSARYWTGSAFAPLAENSPPAPHTCRAALLATDAAGNSAMLLPVNTLRLDDISPPVIAASVVNQTPGSYWFRLDAGSLTDGRGGSITLALVLAAAPLTDSQLRVAAASAPQDALGSTPVDAPPDRTHDTALLELTTDRMWNVAASAYVEVTASAGALTPHLLATDAAGNSAAAVLGELTVIDLALVPTLTADTISGVASAQPGRVQFSWAGVSSVNPLASLLVRFSHPSAQYVFALRTPGDNVVASGSASLAIDDTLLYDIEVSATDALGRSTGWVLQTAGFGMELLLPASIGIDAATGLPEVAFQTQGAPAVATKNGAVVITTAASVTAALLLLDASVHGPLDPIDAASLDAAFAALTTTTPLPFADFTPPTVTSDYDVAQLPGPSHAFAPSAGEITDNTSGAVAIYHLLADAALPDAAAALALVAADAAAYAAGSPNVARASIPNYVRGTYSPLAPLASSLATDKLYRVAAGTWSPVTQETASVVPHLLVRDASGQTSLVMRAPVAAVAVADRTAPLFAGFASHVAAARAVHLEWEPATDGRHRYT